MDILKIGGRRAHSEVELLNMRTGLQLYGVEIVPYDPQTTEEIEIVPLDLVNCDFPFSLRLIACVVRVPLALSNLNLVTLDLSGSALVGVDASWLRAKGSVRLRRCFSSAPVDFAGAQIHGYFDGTDMLLQPFGTLPVGQAVDGDRGMLNLNQASIDNEVRLSRAVIWGGLSMRGLKTQRSIFMNEAHLVSPLGVLEAILLEQAQDIGTLQNRPVGQTHPVRPNKPGYRELCQVLSDRAQGHKFRTFIGGGHQLWQRSCLDTLLRDGMKVRTSALRADGVTVSGSIFARNIYCVGRFRTKYSRISGSLSLEGASLSSAESQRDNFDRCRNEDDPKLKKIWEYRLENYYAIVNSEDIRNDEVAIGSDDFALDLRESHIGGALRIGTSPEKRVGASGGSTHVDGIINLSGTAVEGEIFFNLTEFKWTCRLREQIYESHGKSYLDARKKCDEDRDERVANGEIYAVKALGVKVGGGVYFLGCRGINGLDFENSSIEGDFALFDQIWRKENETIQVKDYAIGLAGRISLIGAQISGDCKLIFNPRRGPRIKAQRLEVAGALMIIPPTVADGTFTLREADYTNQKESARRERLVWRKAAAEGPEAYLKFEMDKRSRPIIDLRNARANLLHHPPPAWPRVGGLRLMGLRYERTLEYGPLCPHPFPAAESDPPFSLRFIMLVLAVCDCPMAWALFAVNGLSNRLGFWNIFALALILNVLIVYKTIIQYMKPSVGTNKPMAIQWLELQDVKRNAYKTGQSLKSYWLQFLSFLSMRSKKYPVLGNTYHSLDPYAVAAKALREEGRWVSANIVEHQRIVVRDWQLSWRRSFFQKVFSNLLNITSQYGFDLNRPFIVVGLLIIVAAMTAHSANHDDAILSKTYCVAVAQPQAGTRSVAVHCDDQSATVNADFTPILYALEQVVPGLGLGQDGNWELDRTKSPFVSPYSVLTYERLFAIFHMLGLSMTGLLLIALSTRLGLSINSYKE